MTINKHNRVTDPIKDILNTLDEAKKLLDSDWEKMRAELVAGIDKKGMCEVSDALMKAIAQMQALTQSNLPDLRLAHLAGCMKQAWVIKEINAAGSVEAFEAGLSGSGEVH